MAANYQHPLQCIKYVDRQARGLQDVFLATAGSRIYCHDATSAVRHCVWPSTIEGGNTEGNNGDAAGPPIQITWANIPLLAVTSDAQHVVVLTAEDKCIRVLNLEGDGSLHQLSAR